MQARFAPFPVFVGNPLCVLGVLCVLCVIALASAKAAAQQYPAKPVRFVVPYPPGGPLDEIARAVGQRLTTSWSQQVLVDNRSGAGGSIGADHVAKTAPDGYTMLLGNSGPITVNPNLRRDLPYDPQRDLAPVTQIIAAPMVLVVHPSLPVKSVRDLVRLAKSKPGQLNYASAGIGNLQHLAMESLQSMAGVRMNHVPYKGAAPAFIDLLSGQVQLMFANIVGVLPHVDAGKVRAIAVSNAKGAPVLPNTPSVAATLPEFDLDGWMGIFVRAGTPPEIIAKLHKDLAAAVSGEDFKERFAKRGAQVAVGGPEGLAKIVRYETALYGKIIQSAGIRPQ
ncbi:MAG: Bug family tripartite tricarboxylate transporter substrate binding protein [Betaproteobacteria bacterium]